MIKQSLQIKYDDGGVAKTFPEGKKPAVIGTFTYEAQRMGSAPTISATLYYPECLDAKWSGKEYVEFRGTKYYAFRKPVSSKSNDTFMYKHEVQFVDERIVLDNTFFLDVVTASTKTAYKDRYRSNTTKFSFMGTLAEFVARVNDSMVYSGLCTYSKDASTGVETWNGYHIVIDEGVSTDETVEVKVEETYLVDAIQEIYNSFKLNYYWVGKTCHVGNFQNAVGSEENPLKYQKGLLSVNVSDTNNKIFDRITGVGSSENIPYYYPNEDTGGGAVFSVTNYDKNKVIVNIGTVMGYNTNYGQVTYTLCKEAVSNTNIFPNIKGYDLDTVVETGDIAFSGNSGENAVFAIKESTKCSYPFKRQVEGRLYMHYSRTNGGYRSMSGYNYTQRFAFVMQGKALSTLKWQDIKCNAKVVSAKGHKGDLTEAQIESGSYTMEDLSSSEMASFAKLEEPIIVRAQVVELSNISDKFKYSDPTRLSDDYPFVLDGLYALVLHTRTKLTYLANGQYSLLDYKVEFDLSGQLLNDPRRSEYVWNYGEKSVDYNDSGISMVSLEGVPTAINTYTFVDDHWESALSNDSSAVKVKITERDYITPCSTLMPSIYRISRGAARFYDAKNDNYIVSFTGKDGKTTTQDQTSIYQGLHFNNKFVPGNPHEGKQDFTDIKPSIKDVYNENNKLFGEIVDVSFDTNDNDLLKADGETYEHQYFYIKLNKFDGVYGFDLFKQAIENDEMTIQMTTGACASCAFKVMSYKREESGRYIFDNPVHVTEQGNLKLTNDSGTESYLLNNGENYDANNQNSYENELWIAIQKDNTTFGVIMPNKSEGYAPKAGDKFVITGIKMPSALVLAAENRLDKALIQYMKENNDVVTSMSVTFSRNWLNANSSLVSLLNENAKVRISYDNKDYDLFVSNYTCRADENILYDITVELSAKLSVSNSQSVSQSSGLTSQFVGSIGGVQLTQIDIDELRTLLQDSFLSKDDMATITGKFNDLFLSKTEKDTANGNITFNKGIVAKGSLFADNVMNVGAADYSPNGVGTNSGVEMTADGTIKAKRLELGESMVVPSIQYNNAEWVGGNTWRSAGGGVVKNCVEYNNKYLLMLEVKDGEAGKIAVGDKCQGIYHKISGNSSTDSDGHNGHFTFKGFTTIYFQVEELITGFSEGETFNVCDALGITKYELSTYLSRNAFAYIRPRSALDSTYTDSTLPQPQMNFAVYANNGNSARQQVCLETPKYTIYLSGMTNWTYGESNIQLIVGSDLSGFTINRTKWDVAQGKYVNADPIALSGAGMAIGNLYQWGNIKQFDRKPTLVSQQIHFLANTSTVAPEKTDANWDKTGTKATKALPYLWCYYTYTYSDGQTSSSDVFLSANFASDGTSVKILGSFNTKAELETAYANQQLVAGIGNGYMVQADGHLWSFVVDAYSGVFADDIKDMGQIKGDKGDQGAKGDNGKDVIDVKIYTNTGQFRIEKNGTITLTAEVYKGEENITSSFSALDFSWTRESDHTDLDAIWNAQHVGVGRTITIGNDDIDRKAAFNCIINI